MDHISQETKKFGETTTIRGVPRIVKSKDVFLKVAWSFAVLTCTAVLIAFLVTLFQKFYQWPVTSRFGEDSKASIVFPDITICSINRFMNLNNDSTVFKSYQRAYDIVKNRNMSYSEHNMVNSMGAFIMNMKKDIKAMKDDCPNFIASCKMYSDNWQAFSPCHDNFSERWNGEYFSCQTLKTSSLKIADNKVVRGISLILNIGPPNIGKFKYDDYITASQAYGAVLSIHSSGSEPDLKKSFTVAPGTESVVKIQQTNIERLDKPHNPQGCTLQKHLTDSTNAAYTKDLCMDHCQQNAIFKKCNCVVHWYALPDSLKDAPVCVNFSEVVTSFNDFKYKMNCSVSIKVQKCDQCKLPCREFNYQYTVSSAPWPPTLLLLSVYQTYVRPCIDCSMCTFYSMRTCCSTGTCCSMGTCCIMCTCCYCNVRQRYDTLYEFDQIYSNNLATFNLTQFKIKLPEMNQISESMMVVKLVTEDDYPLLLQEKPAYTWDVMISLVGGMLSLWLGISITTVIELLELFYHIIKGYSKKSNATS